MKLLIVKIKPFILFVAMCISTSAVYAQYQDDVYNLTLEELMSINVIPDTSQTEVQPSYEISIQDLMNLEIVRELKVEHVLDVSYDVPLEDLLQIKINIERESEIEPTYEMSLQGLTSLEIKEKIAMVEKIGLTYDLSLDGVLKLSLKNPPKQNSLK
mgnify:CR=1 FL=1